MTLYLALALLSACSGSQGGEKPPVWSRTSVDFGQGQLDLGVRFRWVADPHPTGAVIRTPDGGEAIVRVFSCGQSEQEIQQGISRRLRSRLLGSHIHTEGRVFYWRWRQGKTMTGKVMGTAVASHGPLLIAVTSSTLTMEDLIGVAKRVRLELPVPTIPSCFPLCTVDSAQCVPQTSEDEG